VLIAFALLMLTYQSLDNIDGKQARRTSTHRPNLESSSPLGMLFDHGSDSLCSFLIGMSVLKILCVTNRTLMLFIIITHVLSVFFCAIWSQYNTNNFELGRVNPVDDGIPTVAIVAILNCFIP
jgi:ethanolaminephosphotransferase